MARIQDLVQEHEKLIEAGKANPISAEEIQARMPAPIYPAVPPTVPMRGGIRGSFPSDAVSDVDFASTHITGAPLRSPMFPIQPKVTSTNVATKQIVQLSHSPSAAAPRGQEIPATSTPIVTPTPSPTQPTPIGGGPRPGPRPQPPFPGPPGRQRFPVEIGPVGPTGGPFSPTAPPPRSLLPIVGSTSSPLPIVRAPLPNSRRLPLLGDTTIDQMGDGLIRGGIARSHVSTGVAYNFRGVWNANTGYTQGDEVVYLTDYWVALNASVNSTPGTGNSDWQVIGTYSAFLGAWSALTSYAAGAEVTHNGNFWVAVNANTNSEPTLTNPDWQIAGPVALDNVADGNGSGGGTYQRMPIVNMDVNRRGLVDLTQTGHIGSASNYREMVTAAAPVAYYKLDEQSGTVVVDSGPNHLNGTYSGAITPTTSAIQGELQSTLAGGSQNFSSVHGSVPFNAILNPAVFSVAVWIYPTTSAAGNHFVMISRDNSATHGYTLDLISGNINAFICTGAAQVNVGNSPVTLNNWHFVVLTYDGTNARFYVDGVLALTTTTAFSANTTTDFFIGSNTAGSENFNQSVDELAVFNTALSAQQISGLYQAGSVGPHRTVDDVPDGSTYNRFKAANMFDGGILPTHVTGQLANIDIGTLTPFLTASGAPAATGWFQAGTITVDIPAGLNSITFTISTNFLMSTAGTFSINTGAGQGVGISIYTGGTPATPQANSNGATVSGTDITVTNPTSGTVSLTVYVSITGGGEKNVSGAMGIHTTLPVSASKIS